MSKLTETFTQVKRAVNNVGIMFTNGEPLLKPIGQDFGEFGEYASEHVLNNMALTDLSYIKTLHNIYLDKNGSTTEIDVIALTEKGIFVLESKNYSGWIFGSYESTKWTQSFPNGEKTQFYNPVKQNESHIKTLSKNLEISSNCIFSYIVFSNRCELKKIPPNTDHISIIQRNQLLWKMMYELKNGRTYFVKNEIDCLYNKLYPLTQKNFFEKQQHIEEVRKIQSGNICPFCKKELVLRHGKFGDFYGCSGYPNCKFTRKI